MLAHLKKTLNGFLWEEIGMFFQTHQQIMTIIALLFAIPYNMMQVALQASLIHIRGLKVSASPPKETLFTSHRARF